MGVNFFSKKIGSVLIIGGGIGGMQSALDLADSGYKVYLVEETPSIGGVMAQLDKTFPTNDCSMCIMSPKMVDVGRHPNIELLSYSELESIKGKEGNYKVKVKRKARSIDESKCTGCGICIENCPVKLQIQIPQKQKEPKVRDKKFIDELVVKHSEKKRPLVQIMLDVNEKYRYLPRDVLEYLSYKLDIPLTSIYRVATFYKAFSLQMRGKYHIKVCLGTACHVRGARKLVDAIRGFIGKYEEGLFSIETVNCLGTCALGPVIVVNDEIHGNVSIEKMGDILASYGGNKCKK
jgi:NADH:ubiquinone oxidoreductase subunit E